MKRCHVNKISEQHIQVLLQAKSLDVWHLVLTGLIGDSIDTWKMIDNTWNIFIINLFLNDWFRQKLNTHVGFVSWL